MLRSAMTPQRASNAAILFDLNGTGRRTPGCPIKDCVVRGGISFGHARSRAQAGDGRRSTLGGCSVGQLEQSGVLRVYADPGDMLLHNRRSRHNREMSCN
jgi:hypothetical protein